MASFSISNETYNMGFTSYVTLNPLEPVRTQLDRRRLVHRKDVKSGNLARLQRIIEENSSLKVNFGWSFESGDMFCTIMEDCMQKLLPKYNINVGNIITDIRCSWLGFVPDNMFEKSAYENLSAYGLVLFNNEMASFQEDVVEFVSSNKVYRQHSLTRDGRYRYNLLKTLRKDKDALEDIFWQYINAIRDTIQLHSIPRDIVEEDLGCHFLQYPELFFELMAFAKLKGEIYE